LLQGLQQSNRTRPSSEATTFVASALNRPLAIEPLAVLPIAATIGRQNGSCARAGSTAVVMSFPSCLFRHVFSVTFFQPTSCPAPCGLSPLRRKTSTASRAW